MTNGLKSLRREGEEKVELWATVEGFPNYEVSSYGNVRHKVNMQNLIPSVKKDGYLRVTLGHHSTMSVHRLVATAFCERRIDTVQVRHMDDDPKNNHCDNLKWCTVSEIAKHSVGMGRNAHQKATDAAKLVCRKPVRIVEENKIFPSLRECAKYLDCPPPMISRVLIGDRKRVRGVHIEYVEECDNCGECRE